MNARQRPNFLTAFGQETVTQLCNINPKNCLGIPQTSNPAWSTIQAAKVLLQPGFVSQPIANIDTTAITFLDVACAVALFPEGIPPQPNVIRNNDGGVPVITAASDQLDIAVGREGQLPNISMTRNANGLINEVETLLENQLLVLHGDEEGLDHYAIIAKKAGATWLIDADRGVYKSLTNNPSSYVHTVHGPGAASRLGCLSYFPVQINYLTMTTTNAPFPINCIMSCGGDEVGKNMEIYKVTSENVRNLPDPTFKNPGLLNNRLLG